MRPVRREPGFDESPLRRPRRAPPLDGASRPLIRRTDEEARSSLPPWLPRLSWRAPVLMASAGLIGLAAAAGAASGGGIERAALSLIGSDAFYPASEIRILGQNRTPRAQLVSAIKFRPGDDLARADLDAIRTAVENLDWVRSASVARYYPGSLAIRIAEKQPFALWQNRDELWLIERDGGLITREGIENFSTLPLFVGKGAPLAAATLNEQLARQPSLVEMVRAAVRVGERRWDLHMKNGVTVLLPEEGVDEALARLAALERDQELLQRDIKSVDLRLPDRLIVTPKAGATPPRGQDRT